MELKVSPIRKPDVINPFHVIRNHMQDMKIGEIFDISFPDKKEVPNIRQYISRFSRKDKIPVRTRVTSGNILTVERIRK